MLKVIIPGTAAPKAVYVRDIQQGNLFFGRFSSSTTMNMSSTPRTLFLRTASGCVDLKEARSYHAAYYSRIHDYEPAIGELTARPRV